MLTVEFKDKLDLLLIKYEDEIMEVMFEESKDEYGERYAEVYKVEWYYYKQSIVKTLYDMYIADVKKDTLITSLAYMLLTNLMNITSIDEDTDIEKLINISHTIFKELEVED